MKRDRDPVLVKHILKAIDLIESFTSGKSFRDFQKDELLQNGVVLQLIIIGEASANLSDTFKERHSKIPFHRIVGMRNRIVHGYWEVNEDIVWKVCKKHLPELKEKLEKVV